MGKRTPKALALGNALRQARLEKGFTLRDFAGQIQRDPGVLSRWETGDRIPRPEQVAQILTSLGVAGEQYDDVMTLVYGTDEPQWVATTLPEQRQQLAAYIEFEQSAQKITEITPLMIPGLLQTTDHVRAIMTAGGVPPVDIPTRIAVRAGRREVITRPNPARLLALVGQAALYQNIGGHSGMLAQLHHLVEVNRLPNVDVRIVPFGVGWHPGLEGAFNLIESDNAPAVVFLDTRRSTLWLHKEVDVNAYKQAAEMVARVALDAEESMRLITDLIQRMENRDVLPGHPDNLA
ncbi:Putative DNA-binding protein [Alloactinosynnema sp. L-07]|uniref:helix-turn-helix domain-containing protein n=1 Tax=Alloactinosynnema sp. L-07 TaxID=1653480 RepID=UPI00065F0604|nr:helix-turn-helix transcriptional regulator [Alloactinosynnema sp. L-07]CRK60183.1 Putative DNA-binding protein [Alloactinosynnema sp. L-07]